MVRRGDRRRRSKIEWAIRSGVALIIAVLGYLTVAHALAYSIRLGDPARAHALSPGDGRITALLAQRLSGPDATATDRRRADDLAREALRREPTAVAAASTLGINAQLRGDTRGARRLFAYAERLSRRDLGTQLWAVEDAVARGDIIDALRHYDIALRTSATAHDVLFPILGSAVAEPAVRSALARTLVTRPLWGPAFVHYAATLAPDPRATVRLFGLLVREADLVPEADQAAVIAALVKGGWVEEAWSYYAAVRPGVDRRMSRDPTFSAGRSTPSVFDWMPVSDPGMSVSIQSAGAASLVDFAVSPSVGGALIQQTQLLPPGLYRLEGHSIGIDQARGATPYWTLTCRDGRELGRVEVPNSSLSGGRFAGQISVPAGCSLQTLALIARPSDAVSGLSGQIDRLRLQPIR